MITRRINNVEIDINEKNANELYFYEDFVNRIGKFNNDIETIKKGIYEWGNNSKYIPLSILWELTNKCNFQCPFCYINTPLAKRTAFQSFNEIKSIIDDLIEMGMMFCTLSGGECLLHPSFIDIYKYLKENGVVVSIFSNGMLVNKELLALFEEYKPYKVEISIYGLSDEVFSNVTKSELNCKSVLNNILKIKNLGIKVRCKTPITKLTSVDIPNIRSWCKENDIDYYVSDELLDTYYGESNDLYKTTDDTYFKALESKENAYRKNTTRSFGIKKAWECSAGKYSGVIAADGHFYPCMSSVGIEKYQFSMKKGIKESINNYIKVLDREKGKNLDFCKGCNNYNICEKCVLSSITDSKEDINKNCIYINKF